MGGEREMGGERDGWERRKVVLGNQERVLLGMRFVFHSSVC
jgi:hypothetical protein